MDVKEFRIEAYDYELPENKIAFFPLEERDTSKLLVYKNKQIEASVYRDIAKYIPEKSLLIFNNTKVFPARILFSKLSGAIIEIFVLEGKEMDITVAMLQRKSLKIKCLIGGAAKWKPQTILTKEIVLDDTLVSITANFVAKEPDCFVIELHWGTNHDFATVVEAAGKVPLPPYIKRAAAAIDAIRYQTIYAIHKGSVAAPTAGLHFTPKIFESFSQKEILTGFVTLHVGAGTFKPVTVAQIKDHVMHEEFIVVEKEFIEKLYANEHHVIAVGTTSVRTIESLYWMGVKIIENQSITKPELKIEQWDVYQLPVYEKKDAISALLKWMQKNNLEQIITTTQLLIVPTYTFNMLNAIITNFHQPKSTLLLLIAAATDGNWKALYDYALENEFRFLSYGDGCLIYL